MAIVASDWTIDRSTKKIAYIGDDHSGASPSYATVIEFHRWLQSLADDAVASGDDELDITNEDPSRRSTDNIITLINGYTLEESTGTPASEHLYDGSIIQSGGDDIWDGIVNFGNSDVQIQIIQDGAVLADDWWNYAGAGLNPNSSQGISHRFMIKVRESGSDIDGRRLIGTARRFGYTYQEFVINGTSRGNNVLALSDATDLNNQTSEGTVGGWTGITNLTEGYVGIDVDNNGSDEYYYSQWDKSTYSINDFYERMKYLTRDGSSETLYGLSGELFRGITHEINYGSLTGTFDETYLISWSGTNSGTGQVLADNGTDKVWIQLLTGVAPVNGDTLSQSSPDSASATVSSTTDRSSLISTPFVGVSTGSAIIGAYGLGIEATDLTASDKVFDLTNTQVTPPNYVTNTVAGLVSGEDRVLVAPWDGSSTDVNGDPAINKNQLTLSTSLTTDNITSVVVADGDETAIPSDTPSSGYIRVTDDDGFERLLHYTSWSGTTFTIDTTDGNEDFASVNATAGNDVYIAYIDTLATGSSESFTSVYSADRDLMVLVRDGGGTPIFMATVTLSNAPTVIDNAESTTNWGGDTFSLEPDIKLQGSNSVACTFTPNSGRSQTVYVTGSWDFSTGGVGDQHIRLWLNTSIIAYMETEANDGIQIFLYDGSNYAYWTVGGSDTYAGGWQQFVIYTGSTPTSGSVTKSSITRIGFNIAVHSKPRNVTNMWLDAWTYGDGYTVTGGTSGDEIDWRAIAAVDETSAYGIVTEVDGIFFLAGDIKIGSGSTTTYFKSGETIVFKDLPVNSTLYNITFQGSGCNVDINGGAWLAGGTQRYGLDASTTAPNAFSMQGVQVSRLSGASFASGQTIKNCVFNDSYQVDPSTSTFEGNTFSNSTDTGGALLWPSNDSNIKDLKFINCDYGVEYDSSSDTSSPTFNNLIFDDVSGNYDVNNTSGSTVSIYLTNGSNANSYTGSTVNFISNPVTTKVTVNDLSTGSAIENARVLLWVTDNSNYFYEASVTITGSGTTATVSHTSHGLSTGDNVIIKGANEDVYNGAYSVTVVDSNSYTYTTSETIGTSPATGTITSTMAFLNGLTDSNGQISDTRSISSDQPVYGWVRKSTTSPYYQQGVISGTISSSSGLSVVIQLVKDE